MRQTLIRAQSTRNTSSQLRARSCASAKGICCHHHRRSRSRRLRLRLHRICWMCNSKRTHHTGTLMAQTHFSSAAMSAKVPSDFRALAPLRASERIRRTHFNGPKEVQASERASNRVNEATCDSEVSHSAALREGFKQTEKCSLCSLARSLSEAIGLDSLFR